MRREDRRRSSTAGVIIGCCNLIAHDHRYLLVREAKTSARQRYNLPAGKPELNETLVDTAAREAREETGLTVRIDHLVGIYHCPKTSEGFGVVNFVFSARPVDGQLAPSPQHPEVSYFSRAEFAELAGRRMIRGAHIERAIDDYESGRQFPLSLVEVVAASPLPSSKTPERR